MTGAGNTHNLPRGGGDFQLFFFFYFQQGRGQDVTYTMDLGDRRCQTIEKPRHCRRAGSAGILRNSNGPDRRCRYEFRAFRPHVTINIDCCNRQVGESANARIQLNRRWPTVVVQVKTSPGSRRSPYIIIRKKRNV